jgi:tRNA A37 threonylcarbamoyladenosine synthetase subunit TsaC/SUA5/YrdC
MVLVGSANGASGVATDFDESCRKLSEAFWPGLLTLQLAPNPSLPWDLGDGRSLGEFALRSPNREFILALLARSGPLAAASASLAGQGPSLEINAIAANLAEIALFVDEGVLEAGPLSTVLRRAVIGERGLEVLREGAISLSEIRKHLPEVL